jgi:two-component system response regulator AtoC
MKHFVVEEIGASLLQNPRTQPGMFKGLRVLIVDDEEGFCWTLTKVLEDLNYMVISAHTPAQALKHLQSDPQIGLALLDLRVSEVGGTEGLTLLEKFKTLSPRMPVILMSAFGTQELKSEAARLGAQAFLDKPFRVEKLLRVMREAAGGPITPNQGSHEFVS